LIGAVTKPGDLVVDPAGGNFVVLRTPMALGRVFIGCNIAHHREDQTAA
jgi:DNA modification methylase